MEANVAEAQFIDGLFELQLTIIANECAGEIGPPPDKSKNRSSGLVA